MLLIIKSILVKHFCITLYIFHALQQTRTSDNSTSIVERGSRRFHVKNNNATISRDSHPVRSASVVRCDHVGL